MVNGPAIIILDGLDKCRNKETLLKPFSSGLFSKLPHNFRFLITSRWGSEIADSFLAFPDSVHQVFLNISDNYASPVIGIFDHMNSIYKQSNRSDGKNRHKFFFDCFSPGILSHDQPICHPHLLYDFVSDPQFVPLNEVIHMSECDIFRA